MKGERWKVVGPPLIAILLSILLHVLVAAGLAFYMDCAPAPDKVCRLDLTRIDLSFSEAPDETAEVAPASASTPHLQPPKVHAEHEAPLPVQSTIFNPQPHLLDTTDLPDPVESRERLETPPSPTAPCQAKIDAPAKPCRNIIPDYPKESRHRKEEGSGMLEIEINDHGTVDRIHLVQSSGFPRLDEAAIQAFRAARFIPAKAAGRAVSSMVRQPFSFKLK